MSKKRISSEEEMLLELVESDGVGLVDELLDNVQANVETQSLETVDALLGSLGEEEFAVVDKYFGLSGDAPLSADEIGDLMGLNSDQIASIIGGALRQLRRAELAEERKVA